MVYVDWRHVPTFSTTRQAAVTRPTTRNARYVTEIFLRVFFAKKHLINFQYLPAKRRLQDPAERAVRIPTWTTSQMLAAVVIYRGVFFWQTNLFQLLLPALSLTYVWVRMYIYISTHIHTYIYAYYIHTHRATYVHMSLSLNYICIYMWVYMALESWSECVCVSDWDRDP